MSTAAALVAVLLACGGGGGGGLTGPPGGGGGGGGGGGVNTVIMGGSTFSPTLVTIQPGGAVTWSNTSGIAHNVMFSTSGSPSNIPDHTSGTNVRTFGAAGTFNYSCTNHGGMNGSIYVQ